MDAAVPLFARPDFQQAAGDALRPGGTALTTRGLELCAGMGDLPAGARVADVGCGRGASLALLAGRGLSPVGLDLSPELLGHAREHACGRTSGQTAIPLLRASALSLPLAAHSCAAVLCECVLSLLGEPGRALDEFSRVLAPGGFLILTDLYLRARPEAGTRRAAGCAAGAAPQEEILQRLGAAGFTVRLFEDHSRLLAELAGRLLFAGLSLADLAPSLGTGRTDGQCGCAAGRPGYFLCIAVSHAAAAAGTAAPRQKEHA
ncbi:Methyltransferase type 11 [Desulfovibrio sp. X2]|uniref:DVU_1556 family methyltransferase n=1 Tax=Desulfovibrio sp. X2 TaxID=941449 RepID=UPI000358C3BC|nr:class I SAM-dependent methyltransferase [Desulfovibrio sp. X2]EPR41253.1 Methyltransferase type 11 [Desulfovibrio sp. X2]